MAEKNSRKEERKAGLGEELAELIKRAQEQPGVAAFMEVYNSWKTFDAVHKSHQRVIAVKRVVALSDTSGSEFM